MGVFNLQWHFTENCNLKCKHCYQIRRHLKEELSLKGKKAVIDHFAQTLNLWRRSGYLVLTGGEPFLKRHEFFEILKYAQKKYPKIKKGVLSNGTLICKEDVLELKKFGVREVQISLDGASKKTHEKIRGKGTFEKATNAVRLLKAGGIKTSIMFVAHKKNMADVPKLVDLAIDLNVDKLAVTRLIPTGVGKGLKDFLLSKNEVRKIFYYLAEQQTKMIKAGRKIKISTHRPLWCLLKKDFPKVADQLGGGCGAGLDTLTLMPNGDVMPCRRMNMVIGNIKTDSFFEIWKNSKTLQDLRDRNNLRGKCRACSYREECGGCRALPYALNKDYLAEDGHCWK